MRRVAREELITLRAGVIAGWRRLTVHDIANQVWTTFNARVVRQFEIRLGSLQLAAFEYDHLFYEPRGSRGEGLAVGRYLIGDQGYVLVPFLRDECKNV